MYPKFRGILVALIVAAFLGEAVQVMLPVQAANDATIGADTAMDMPCDHMASMQGMTNDAAGHPMPCKGITPDCAKQMGCITIPAVAGRFATTVVSVSYTKVVYPSRTSDAEGLAPKPDLLPPRTT